MNLFLAKIVYKIVKPNLDGKEQFDEQLCFVNARDYREAFFKARMLGVKNEDQVDNESGAILWKFIDVPYLKEILHMDDGHELHSSITERDEEDGYEKFVKARAEELHFTIEKNLIPVVV
jgi:hypothetical protein